MWEDVVLLLLRWLRGVAGGTKGEDMRTGEKTSKERGWDWDV